MRFTSGLGLSFLVRRARSSWLLLACVAVTVLLATGLAAVLWTFAGTVVPSGALSGLASAQGRSVALSGVVSGASQRDADSRTIRATLGLAWPGVGFQLQSALWAEPIEISSPITSTLPIPSPSNGPGPSPGPFAATTTNTQIQPASLEGISSAATLTAGQWPGPPGPGGLVPVALPATVASELHLTPGSVLKGSPEAGGAPVTLRVTGLFRPKDPGSPYWALDPLPSSGSRVSPGDLTVTYGPAVVDSAAFGGTLTVSEASWLVSPQAPALARGNIATLTASTSAAITKLAVSVLPDGLQATSGLPQLLSGIASTIVLTRSLFTIAALQLLLVAGAVLVLAARLLASQRDEESALLRARGATRGQLTRPALAEALVIGAAAGLVGALAGIRLSGPLASLGGLRLGSSPGRGITGLVWLSALAMLVLCAAVMAWPALQASTPNAVRLRRGRQARVAAIAGAGGDLALVALAVVAVWQLRGFSAVAHPATGSLGIDPVVAIAPALALAGVALIPLRGLPLLARLADKATDYERRLAAAMVSWQIARRPIRQTGPALLVVVATATTTLALAGYASWQRSAADQAAFTVGSDVRVDAQAPLPLGGAAVITRAPGVTAATAASLASIGTGDQLIALDARTAGQAILLRPDLSPLPLSTLWRRITRPPSGVALPGRPDRLEVLAALGPGPGTSAAQLGKELGFATVTAWIQDASGATYPISAAEQLTANGQPQPLVFPLSEPGASPGQRQASDPLRLIGLTLAYNLPQYDRAHPSSAPAALVSIESFAVAETASGPFARPFSHGAALAAWVPSASSLVVPTGPPNAFGGLSPDNGATPAITGWQAAGAAAQLTFSAGHDPSPKIQTEVGFNPAGAPAQVAITAPSPSGIIPGIATAGFLTANRLGIGSTISESISGLSVTVRIVASVASFPTVFGSNRALITDLAEVNDVLVAGQTTPLPVTRWWLSTVDDRVPRLPAGLGLSVASRASQQAALLGNPLLTGPRQAMLSIGAAAVLLGVLGFSISVAASLRSRRSQSAVFAALGVGKNAQAGQLCLEQCALSLPAAVAGLLAGIGLAELMVPAITLTTDATAPVPSALVILPLGPAIAAALITAALPVAAAALSVLRRPDPAKQLRAEAG